MSNSGSEDIPLDIKAEMERVRLQVSREQRKAMLTYIKEHPSLLTRKSRNVEPSNKHGSWAELATVLNNIETGTRKTAARWRKSFQDWRSDVRAKVYRQLDGGVTPALTSVEKELFRITKGPPEEERSPEDPLQDISYEPVDKSLPEDEDVDVKPKMDIQDWELSDNPSSSPEPDRHRPKKRRRKETQIDDTEERAIRAMELQATSLDRMATAMESIADAVIMALKRFGNGKNNDT